MQKEIWKDIEDFPNYEVSDQGRVRNKKTKAITDIKKWTAKAAGGDLGKYRRYIYENIESKIPSDLEDDELHPNKYKQLKKRLKKAVKDKDYAEI